VTYDGITRSHRTAAGALAVAMHLAFFALLFVSVSWQQVKPDAAAIVDLWANLPPLPEPRAEPPPAPPPEVKPEPPKPVPRVEPKPEPKPVPKPDIALKEKLEKERKLKEQQALEEKKRLAELKKKEEEAKKLAALKAQQEAAEAKRREEELQAALKEAQAREAAQAAARDRAVAEYSRLVSDRIRRHIVLPPGMQGNPQAEFEVVQIPGGEVLNVRLRRTSGVPAYDAAVERAIRQAAPLPAPPAPLAFSDVRELNLKFRPKE
jgi:colicin import membrane protein